MYFLNNFCNAILSKNVHVCKHQYTYIIKFTNFLNQSGNFYGGSNYLGQNHRFTYVNKTIKYLQGPQTFFRSVLKFRLKIKMEIICAGYPKTGSKTCSAALKVLRDNFFVVFKQDCRFWGIMLPITQRPQMISFLNGMIFFKEGLLSNPLLVSLRILS